MQTADFSFDLPPALIAQRPLPSRTDSRMMVIDCAGGSIDHRKVSDLPDYLAAEDVLVLNDTRVVPARVFARWDDTGGVLELLLVQELFESVWDCLYKARRRIAPGQTFTSRGGRITGHVHGVGNNGRIYLQLFGTPDLTSAMDAEGVVPLPPYIGRKTSDEALQALDRDRYQTVFANAPGAVAAPTAGLHFSEALLARIAGLGTRIAHITLHVGPGTFKPVKARQLHDHRMDAERFVISTETALEIARTRARQGRVVAVGTTSVRTLESAADDQHGVSAGDGESRLFIYPPYSFGVVDALLTNFHLPESTLLMLVSAFAAFRRCQAAPTSDIDEGRQLILHAYHEAIREGYRFYSYGDCMLLV